MQRLFPLFVLLALAAPWHAQAASICACYVGEQGDCQQEAIGDGRRFDCEAACESTHGEQLKRFEFHADANFAVQIMQDCSAAHAAASPKPTTQPVVPKLQVEIPGVAFTPITQFGGVLNVNFLGEYLAGAYRYLIGIAAVLAVVMLMIGGFQYALGAGASDQVAKAKTRIKNAVIGLVLLLSAVAILDLINPQLTQYDALKIRFVSEIPREQKDDAGDVVPEGALPDVPGAADDNYFDGGVLCGSLASCQTWCQQNVDEEDWPTANRKTMDPSLTSVIPETPGLKNPSKKRASKEMIAALTKAGQEAVNRNPDSFIQIQDGYRPLRAQIKLACDLMKSGNPKEQAKLGSIIAYPGGSNHGGGAAVDVTYYANGKQVVTSSSKAQEDESFREGAGELADIMATAGMVRYAKEIWHFELEGKTTASCRCKGTQCPFPPRC